MRKILTCTAPCLLAVLLAGCIKNDIPYPRQLGRITAFEVEGQKTAAVIDSTARTVRWTCWIPWTWRRCVCLG